MHTSLSIKLYYKNKTILKSYIILSEIPNEFYIKQSFGSLSATQIC